MTYKDIYTCPIKIYHRIMEGGDVQLLSTDDKEKDEVELWSIFEAMHDQIIDDFGVSDDFMVMFSKQKAINKLELSVLDGNKSDEVHLELAKMDKSRLEAKMKKNKTEDLAKSNARLRRAVESEYRRDMDKLTVHEFHIDLHDLQEKARMKSAAEMDKPKMKRVG